MGEPYVVERRTTVSAPVERVHPLVADFREWARWSPWEGLDPALTRTYSGPRTGVGARYAWTGNRKAGAGSMVVTGETPHRLDVDLAFTRPFPSTSRIELLLEPADGGTEVVWRLVGELTGLARLAARIRSMDRLLGPDLERGLTRLAQVAEQH